MFYDDAAIAGLIFIVCIITAVITFSVCSSNLNQSLSGVFEVVGTNTVKLVGEVSMDTHSICVKAKEGTFFLPHGTVVNIRKVDG